MFERPKPKSIESEDDPFAIHLISLCPESRKLCVAGASSHVILFTYKKTECNEEVLEFYSFKKKSVLFFLGGLDYVIRNSDCIRSDR